MHVFYFLCYLYSVTDRIGKTKGFKVQIGAILLYRKERKIHRFCSEEKKRSHQLDMLCCHLMTIKKATFLVSMLFPLSILKLWYSYLRPEEPSSLM